MNTFGKTLIICNMVAAVAVGALMYFVYERRINWKKGFDDQKEEMLVRETRHKTDDQTKSNLNQDVKDAIARADAAARKMTELEEAHKGALAEYIVKAETAERSSKEADLSKERVGEENKRLKLENNALAKTLQASEQAKLDLQETANRFYKQAEDLKNARDTLQIRNENLAELIRQKDKLLQELSTRGGPAGANVPASIVRNPNDPNPPSTRVKGIIEKIDRRAGDAAGVLLQLSVGIDHGVHKNNTLDVYRTEPRPEYLGTIRIIESYQAKSVGRLMRQATVSPLREGDIVVDSIGAP